MNFTLTASPNLPVGATVTVYSRVPGVGANPAFTGTMPATGTLTVTGLHPATKYVARTNVNGTVRNVQFTTDAIPDGSGTAIDACKPPWDVSAANPDNRAAILAARDYCASLGGGTVMLPPGVLKISGTIVAVNNVVFRGAGTYATVLQRSVDVASAVASLTGTSGAGFCDMTLDGNFAAYGGGALTTGQHGIAMSQTVGTQYARIENLWIRRCRSYGIGFQDAGPYIGNVVRNVRISDTGSDGIDFKNDANLNRDNAFDIILVERFGQSPTDDQRAGIDIRSAGTVLSNIRVREYGLDVDGAINGAVGIRFRLTSANGIGGNESSLTNFKIEGQDATASGGVEINADFAVSVSNGTINNTDRGVRINPAGGQVSRHALTAVHAQSCVTTGFEISDGANYNTLTACEAQGCPTGFLIAGDGNTLVAPGAFGSTTAGIKVAATANGSSVVAARYAGNTADLSNAGTNTVTV